MKELDIVELTKDIPEYNFKKGQRGTIVMIYNQLPKKVEVEFLNEITGETIAIIQISTNFLRLINNNIKK